ncbi:MAG: MFS transporter [Proteobacteria bacterium]|nr:MFS transporter [Pseudomonadota bacterium]
MSAMGYRDFIATNRTLLGFGFTLTFASSVGQTFFIGAFGPAVREAFALSHTEWSGIYMAGTLLSALCLPWTGALIDRFTLRSYTLVVFAALVGAALFMSAVPHVAVLVVAIFLLRQTGQGLTSHISVTTMARYFRGGRGKAVALASLGFAAGESVLPFLVVIGIASIGWRLTYASAAAALVVLILPIILWLLHRHDRQATSSDVAASTSDTAATMPEDRSWTRAEMLRHWRFHLLVPAVMAPSFIGTALFFHHLALAEAKGWSAVWITGNYWGYAVGSVIAGLLAGPLIDRITAVRVVPMFLVPMIAALLIISNFHHPYWAWPYLFLLGVNVGINYTGLAALWAEIYGVRHIGAIRSLIVSFSVLASALGPLGMGAMMDAAVSMEIIAAIFAGYCAIATVLMILGLRGLSAAR